MKFRHLPPLAFIICGFYIFGNCTSKDLFSQDNVSLPSSSMTQSPPSNDIVYPYEQTIILLAVGDLMMGGRALPFLRTEGPDYPFDSLRAIIQSADFAMANLEAPFTHSNTPFDKKYTFRVPPEYAPAIQKAGFDMLTLANNHILDYGPAGLFSTLSVLDSLNLGYCGAGKDRENAEKGMVLENHGWRVGFLAFSLTYPGEFWATSEQCGTAFPHTEILKKRIETMKTECDFLIVSFHWGGDLMDHPKPYQCQYAHQSINWGADLIIGHHPHALQGLELYQGKLIAYSLGNFVFGSYNRNVHESIILKVIFDKNGPKMAELLPIHVYNYDVHFQPRLLRGASRIQLIHRMNQISQPLNDEKSVVSEQGLIFIN